MSVFEMTIRGLGGLLAAHDLSGDAVFLEKCAALPRAKNKEEKEKKEAVPAGTLSTIRANVQAVG